MAGPLIASIKFVYQTVPNFQENSVKYWFGLKRCSCLQKKKLLDLKINENSTELNCSVCCSVLQKDHPMMLQRGAV